MKIILSPAKSLNLSNPIQKDWQINEKTQEIAEELEKKTFSELKTMLKVSDVIAEENMVYIQNFHKKESYKAVELYDGLAYKSLNVREMNAEALAYLQEHLLILSAFYGVLRADNLIKPYRLDFNTRLKIDGKSLKTYWKSYYNSYIEEGETVLNLASKEFSDLFDKTRYDWVDFDFFELEGASKKRHSTIAKKGRGKLLRELAYHQVKRVEEIEKLKLDFCSIK